MRCFTRCFPGSRRAAAWALVLAALSQNPNPAAVLFSEQFPYAAGEVQTVSSGTWTIHSSTPPTGPLVLTSAADLGASLVVPGYWGPPNGSRVQTNQANSPDAGHDFAPQVSGEVDVAFVLRMTSLPGTGGAYIVHFLETGSTSAYRGKVFVRQGATASTWNIGVTKTTNTATFDSTELALNTNYLVVLKYQFVGAIGTDDTVSLYLNPTPGAPEPAPLMSVGGGDVDCTSLGLGRIGLRQAASCGVAEIDGIRVATTWAEAVAGAGIAVAANTRTPAIDGVGLAAGFGGPVCTQAVDTQFGDNSNELDGLFVGNDGTNLYVGFSGNLAAGNRLYAFVDSVSGGVSNLDNPGLGYGEFDDLRTGGASDLTLPDGLAVDFGIVYDSGGNLGLANYIAGSGTYEGAGPYSNGFAAALDNSNTAGVGGTGGALTGNPASVDSGVELAIPLSQIGGPAAGTRVRLFAFVTDASAPRFFSNQFLPGLGGLQGNLGAGSLNLKFPQNISFVEYTIAAAPPAGVSGWKGLE